MRRVYLYKDSDGNIQRSVESEQITREEIAEQLKYARERVVYWEDALAKYDNLVNATPGTDSETETVIKSIPVADGNYKFIKEPADGTGAATPDTDTQSIQI